MTVPDPGHSPSTEVAFLRLQSSLDVGLTRITGQLDVILQRLDQQDKRADDHAAQLAILDSRMDAIERTTATRDDLTQLTAQVTAVKDAAVTKEELKHRQSSSARTITIVVSIIAIIVGVGMGFATSALT